MVYPNPDSRRRRTRSSTSRSPDNDAAVDELAAKGVTSERYDGFEQDEKGIYRTGGGPAIACVTDPAGHVMAVLEQP